MTYENCKEQIARTLAALERGEEASAYAMRTPEGGLVRMTPGPDLVADVQRACVTGFRRRFIAGLVGVWVPTWCVRVRSTDRPSAFKLMHCWLARVERCPSMFPRPNEAR